MYYAHFTPSNTNTNNKFPNYIAYQRMRDGEHRSRLTVKTSKGHYSLTADKEKSKVTTEKCWGKEEPLMKDVPKTYQVQWGVSVKKTQSGDEAE
ncbi:hypothetical protein ACKLNR_011924 [Fusarium oxysporum f. sp. zingiberi]